MNGTSNNVCVDLRSDTLSRPTEAMRKVMFEAEVGDDVFGEDPTIKRLEEKAAEILGKEAGLFLPSGTMANLIAILVHCSARGSELISGDMSHTFLFEQGGPAQIGGVSTAIVKTQNDGTFDLEEVEERIRKKPDCHEPHTTMIIVENTHNMAGGQVLPMAFLDGLHNLAVKYDIRLHMDGARIFSASVKSGLPPKTIVRHFDSACFCLSKNLGCPVGSVLCGSKDFIAKALRMRKVLGGGMRQAGILAAAGLLALDTMVDRLADDHRRTYKIAKAIAEMNSDLFTVNMERVQTNILMIELNTKKGIMAPVVQKRLAEIKDSDEPKVCLKVSSRHVARIRLVTYHNITDTDVDLAIAKLKLVFKEFQSM